QVLCVFFCMYTAPPVLYTFPYTTLFRSAAGPGLGGRLGGRGAGARLRRARVRGVRGARLVVPEVVSPAGAALTTHPRSPSSPALRRYPSVMSMTHKVITPGGRPGVRVRRLTRRVPAGRQRA